MTETMPTLANGAAPAAPASPAPSQQTAPAPAVPVTPGSKAWAEMSPEQRHAQLRGPENPRARGHSPARDQREAVAARTPGQDAPAPTPSGELQAPPEPPADGTKFKVGKFEVSEGELAAMMDRQAQDDLRAATRPASAEAYEAKLPADLKLPGGQTYTFDQNDPSLVAARNLAHAKGWSQQDFSEALGIFASHHAQQEAALAERSRQEIAKAGFNAPQRVDAVSKWITGMVGEADAKPIRATIITDAHLRFYETLINKLTSQGAAGFSSAHRLPAEDSTKIPGFEKMSFEQQRFAQDQLAARQRQR
jgi:hypothetical protein